MAYPILQKSSLLQILLIKAIQSISKASFRSKCSLIGLFNLLRERSPYFNHIPCKACLTTRTTPGPAHISSHLTR